MTPYLLAAFLLLTLCGDVNILVVSLENFLHWILSVAESDPCAFGSCLQESFVVGCWRVYNRSLLISHSHITIALVLLRGVFVYSRHELLH